MVDNMHSTHEHPKPVRPWPNHPYIPPTRWDRVMCWLIDRVPMALLTDAYEFFISFCLALLAIPVALGRVDATSIHAAVTPWVATMWSVTLLIASILTMVGLLKPRYPRIEWIGQVMMAVDLGLYGVAIMFEVGIDQGGISATVFAALSILGGWRASKISFRDVVRERLGREMAQSLVNEARRRRAPGA